MRVTSAPVVARYVLVFCALCLAALPATGFAQPATPGAATPAAAGPTVDVDCGAGDSLADALERHGGGTTFRVRGTCAERVTVARDGVTIDGGGDAVLDAADDPEGPVVHVVGARDVAVRGVTVQNGHIGVLAEKLSTLTLDGVEARGNATHGVEIIQSHAIATGLRSHGNGRVGLIVNRSSEVRLVDGTLEDNGISGLVAFSSAIARLEGTNVVRGNAAQGVTLGLNGFIFTIGADLLIEDNGAAGLSLLQGGAAQFLGGTLTVRGNGGDGVALDLGSTLVLGIAEFGVPGEVLVEENGGHGVSVAGASQLVTDPTMPATVRANAGDGVHVDASDVRLTGSVVEGNDGAGLGLAFGARATVEDTTVDEVACGEGVLVRGSVGCPSSEESAATPEP